MTRFREEEELMTSGHLACQGCGGPIAMRLALKALGEDTICVIPACCWTIISGPFPYSALKVPIMHTAFETAGAAASGVRAALDIQGRSHTKVLAWAGDGGTFDIGLQSLSGAAERNDDIIYICYDNEAYMNTGVQRSSATPDRAWTTTTPSGHPKRGPKKNIVEIMAAHKTPYVATASVAYPEDLMRKVRRAAETRGTTFVHVLSPCPPGWRIDSEASIRIARLATDSKVFPIYEVENGEKYQINVKPRDIPVAEYLKAQGRFNHLAAEDIAEIQRKIDHEWRRLMQKAMMDSYSGSHY
ncbi:MAG: 3-methyl-2-oxobutanoate dehydrogenase subunit beta [Candidatus Schekmanbacteria bacterium]|nr:3-methyl-2-oxobutanoate dehydrogenase subunit beta [Candidatus Schekmanbacteria bacterium]